MNERLCVGLVAALCFAAAMGTAYPGPMPPTENRAQFAGVWEGRRDFGPIASGLLTISRDESGWVAEIAGYSQPVDFADGALQFELPGNLGSFRGQLEAETGTIHGQWIQPGAISMFGQRFSTPVKLRSTGPPLWRGEVQPLQDIVRVYFVLQPEKDGRIAAFLRNPEVNFGRRYQITDVLRKGEAIQFRGTYAWQQDQKPEVLLEGHSPDSLETISVFIENLGGTYDLRKLQDDSVSDFFPRSGKRRPYTYRSPVPRDDGWQTGDLNNAGMATGPIEALIQKIATTPMDAIDSPYIDAVLVARHGKLVLEEYFHGFSADRTHDTRSASKSLTATMIGAGIHEGHVSLDSKVYGIMSGGKLPEHLDPRAARMEIKHLISMQSGLACDDWDPDSPGGEDRMQSQTEQPDWNRYVLDLPMIHEPGEHAAYCSGGMSLAGGVLSRAAGIPLTEYFDRYLARPLQLQTYHTNLMPSGEAYGGGGLRITARDFLKFGQLMLNDGEWNGRRILDPGWSKTATTEQNDLGGERFGSYGYGWWIIEYRIDGRIYPAYYAGGNGGNYIICIPELDLAIVFFGSNYNQQVQHESKYDYVPEFILKSILDGSGVKK